MESILWRRQKRFQIENMIGFGTAKCCVEVHFKDCFYIRLLRKRCFDIFRRNLIFINVFSKHLPFLGFCAKSLSNGS